MNGLRIGGSSSGSPRSAPPRLRWRWSRWFSPSSQQATSSNAGQSRPRRPGAGGGRRRRPGRRGRRGRKQDAHDVGSGPGFQRAALRTIAAPPLPYVEVWRRVQTVNRQNRAKTQDILSAHASVWTPIRMTTEAPPAPAPQRRRLGPRSARADRRRRRVPRWRWNHWRGGSGSPRAASLAFPVARCLCQAALERWEQDEQTAYGALRIDPTRRAPARCSTCRAHNKSHVIYSELLKAVDHPAVQAVLDHVLERRLGLPVRPFPPGRPELRRDAPTAPG